MKMIRIMLHEQNWEIWLYLIYILSAWFQLENWNAPAWLHSARILFGSAQLGKIQLELITTINAPHKAIGSILLFYTNLILFPGPVGGTFSIISVICLIFHILIYTAFKKLRTPAAQNLLALTCALCPAQFFLSIHKWCRSNYLDYFFEAFTLNILIVSSTFRLWNTNDFEKGTYKVFGIHSRFIRINTSLTQTKSDYRLMKLSNLSTLFNIR